LGKKITAYLGTNLNDLDQKEIVIVGRGPARNCGLLRRKLRLAWEARKKSRKEESVGEGTERLKSSRDRLTFGPG